MAVRTPRFWQSKNVLAMSLYPVSLVFRCLVAVRRQCYRVGLFSRYKAAVPVIVVGNITAGGAGKTPLVIALVKYLQSHGRSVGVLCGGYGGTARTATPIHVSADTDPAIAGDEAVVIARQTGVPVVVAKDRVIGAQLLQSDCSCIVTDDGLQHYRLQRNIEIVVVDSARRFGNGMMLPAGPLREPIRRLRSADLVCYSGEPPVSPGYVLTPGALVNVRRGTRMAIASFKRGRVHAVAGIAYPAKFFDMLRSYGFDVVEHSLPDHHRFDSTTLRFDDDWPIIMTEKDSVKCQTFAPDNAWYLEVSAVPDQQLLEQFDQLIGSVGD